jgi:hypothetical protein
MVTYEQSPAQPTGVPHQLPDFRPNLREYGIGEQFLKLMFDWRMSPIATPFEVSNWKKRVVWYGQKPNAHGEIGVVTAACPQFVPELNRHAIWSYGVASRVTNQPATPQYYAEQAVHAADSVEAALARTLIFLSGEVALREYDIWIRKDNS